MAEDVVERGGRRWLWLVVLLAGAAWLVWTRRGTAAVALGNIGVARAPTRPAAPEPQVAAAPEPLPGVAAALPDGSAPGPEYTIKGNRASMLFHLPSSPYYKRTKPQLWFRTPADARAAGFTEWKPKRRATG